MSFRRIPKKIDPRRPPKRRSEQGDGAKAEPRSHGQYIEVSPEEIAELERATGEVAREGTEQQGSQKEPRDISARQELENREEFEDTTDEVSREGR